MYKLAALILIVAFARPGQSVAQPVRSYDDKGAPPFKVLKEGENPPLDSYDNFVIGPKYVTAPERKVVEGVPQGKVQQFTTVSFIGPDRALQALVAACSTGPQTIDDLLERVAPFATELRDRVMDTMDGRHVPLPRPPVEPRPAGRWGSYLLGQMQPRERHPSP